MTWVWRRPAAAATLAGLSIIGAWIYRRHVASTRDAERPECAYDLTGGIQAVLGGMRDLRGSATRADSVWRERVQADLSAFLENRIQDASADHQHELAAVKRTIDDLHELVADEAAQYLRGYMAGWNERGGPETNSKS